MPGKVMTLRRAVILELLVFEYFFWIEAKRQQETPFQW